MTANPRMTKTRKTPKTRWRPSRTNEITDSRAGIATNHRGPDNAATEITPEAATIATGTGNTVSIARSRITLKKNAGRE
jgi:hypothetical protein